MQFRPSLPRRLSDGSFLLHNLVARHYLLWLNYCSTTFLPYIKMNTFISYFLYPIFSFSRDRKLCNPLNISNTVPKTRKRSWRKPFSSTLSFLPSRKIQSFSKLSTIHSRRVSYADRLDGYFPLFHNLHFL